jgi:cysteinyl-tRNA synthetase
VDGDVFYAVETFEDYGKLSGRRLADMVAGSRVEINENKRNPFDFVLWKAAKPGEPSWPSPWGQGRPGWHIECSAMSSRFSAKPFDIHGGGKDLIFPHHENEIAQSEAAHGKPFARYWMHNGFVNIDNEKMSKSLNNFLMIKDILQAYHPETVRLFLLSSHYRSPIDFSDQNLKESEKGAGQNLWAGSTPGSGGRLTTDQTMKQGGDYWSASVKPWTMTSTRPKVSAFF